MAAKKMPAKKMAAKKSSDGPVNPAINDIKKAIEKSRPMPRSGEGPRQSRAAYIKSMQDAVAEGEIRVKGKTFAGTSRLVQTAVRDVAGTKWDKMNNFYKASGKSPKKK